MATIVLIPRNGGEQIRVSMCSPSAFLGARPTNEMWGEFFDNLCRAPVFATLEQARDAAGSDARVFVRTLTGFVECDQHGNPVNPCSTEHEVHSF